MNMADTIWNVASENAVAIACSVRIKVNDNVTR